MALNRRQVAQIYRPVGPKQVSVGLPWSSGGQSLVTQGIDLSLPIRGFRLVFKGRLVIGTAAFTSVNPEGLLNLISEVKIQGTNKRQNGNVTLWDCDLATAWVLPHLVSLRSGYFDINGQVVAQPGTPFPPTGAAFLANVSGGIGYINGATGTYDFRIVCDFPIHPFNAPPAVRPGFLIRNEEWSDTVQILLNYGVQAGAGATGVLGVSAGTTTVTFSSFGSGSGSPTIDIYSLPVEMGLDLKDSVVPGVIVRTTQPLTTILQSVGANVTLLNMQKQPTTRIYVKVGTGTIVPAFATLSDTNLTTLGITLGGNRNVRNRLDVFAHKMEHPDMYGREPIQGYNIMDFVQSGNPDAGYPGQSIGEGASFQLVGDVVGVANALGIVVQEQILHEHAGPLYTF